MVENTLKTQVEVSEATLATTFNSAMARVYVWMATGLAVTALVALGISSTEGAAAAVFGSGYTVMGLFAVQFILVMAIAGGTKSMSVGTALTLFYVFSGVVGVMLSAVLLHYGLGTVAHAFGVAAVTFGGMAFVGLMTKRDLTGSGTLLFVGLLGLIGAGVVNAFLHSGWLQWLTSWAGVAVFMGLTAHDSQAIKAMIAEALAEGDEQVVGRVGVLGALSLYLDFLNLFLYLLNLFGGDED